MAKSFIRYPGGKSRHTDKILRYFFPQEKDYREPFIGGGSVFLASQFQAGWINDLDPGIYDLWRMVKEEPKSLTSLIRKHTKILEHKKDFNKISKALDLWREVKADKEGKKYPLGYRALFLNKTCFSGVQSGGPTGGLHQVGEYNLTSRWAEKMTIERIQNVHDRLQNVKVTNVSYQDLVNLPGDDVSLFLDPPYLQKGGQCYDFAFTLEDHQEFAEVVSKCPHRYVVTIDDCKELRDIWSKLVPSHLILSETWLYSMTDRRDENRVGKEMFISDQRSYDLWQSRLPRQKVKREYD